MKCLLDRCARHDAGHIVNDHADHTGAHVLFNVMERPTIHFDNGERAATGLFNLLDSLDNRGHDNFIQRRKSKESRISRYQF